MELTKILKKVDRLLADKIKTVVAALRYKLVGVTDEVTECHFCGRQGLKKTFVLRDIEEQDFIFAGSDCGLKALGFPIEKGKKEVKKVMESMIKNFEFELWHNKKFREGEQKIKDLRWEGDEEKNKILLPLWEETLNEVAEKIGYRIDGYVKPFSFMKDKNKIKITELNLNKYVGSGIWRKL